jgi:putative MATE family efflux protein
MNSIITPTAEVRPWWEDIREALRGSRRNYTEGPIGRALLMLAVPMVLETLMESLFAVVDVFFVAKLGADAVATVGLTETMLYIIYSIAIGLGIGATAIVARRVGEGDLEGAARAGVQAIILGIVIAGFIALVGTMLSPVLLHALGGSEVVQKNGTAYTRVMLGGNIVIVMLYLINAIFRGAGDAAIAMRVLWFANILNMVLGPCFIFGLGPFPRLGVTGAAVATTIGRGCGVIYQVVQLSRQRGWIVIKRSHIRLDFPLLRRVWNLSTTATLQILIGTTSWIGIVRVLASFGSAAVAGNTIGFLIILFAILPSEGVANAAATMVGQGLGAGNPDRAARAAWLAAFYNMVFLGAIGTVFILFPRQIVSVFTNDTAVATYAASCLRTVAYGFLFYAYGMVLTNALNGAGDTWTPTFINLGIFWIFEIPLAYALANHTQLGPYGVFWAMTMAYSALAVVSGIVFARGQWRHKRV